MKQKKTWILILTILLLAAVMIGMYIVYRRFSAKPQAGEKHIQITIVSSDQTETDYELDTDAEYLREALESVAEIDGEESAEFGYTLYTVNGVTADFTRDQSYWAIYVNGEYGAYSLSQQPIADGDHFTIAYEQY